LVSEQARELLAELAPPYDLMARWQLYTGLRISELLRLGVSDIERPPPLRQPRASRHRGHAQGPQAGYVIAPASLLDETDGYVSGHRFAWLQRARRRGRAAHAPGVVRQRPRRTGEQERLPARRQPGGPGLRLQGDDAPAARHLRMHAAGPARAPGQPEAPRSTRCSW
jgi:integrase